jgi:hypothetical protein
VEPNHGAFWTARKIEMSPRGQNRHCWAHTPAPVTANIHDGTRNIALTAAGRNDGAISGDLRRIAMIRICRLRDGDGDATA